jgi:hypothetical protein
MTASNGRPARVTFIAVIVWIQALFDLIGGISLLVLQNDPGVRAQLGGTTGVIVTGIVLIALALIVFAIARGLLRGSRTARAIVTVVQLLSIVSVIYAAAVIPAQLVSAAVSAAISLIVIIMLWSGRAGDFFRS